jgi:4-hydroxy-3-polyprenylbenzoate decarboxylase
VTPNISYVAVTRFPLDVDELGIAGGLAGEPVELVKCKTVNLEVPAHAEIVIEGIIPTDTLEPEGPFGEFTGYQATREVTCFMEVTAITHRRDAICQGFVSQFPPSESSKIRQISWEQPAKKMLRVDRGMTNVLDVAFHERTGSWGLCVVRIKKQSPDDAKKIFDVVADLFSGKMVVVVDEDIDPRNPDSVLWAMSFRMQPHRDVVIRDVKRLMPLDYSIASPLEGGARGSATGQLRASTLCVDATMKWPFPPTSLPGRDVMERARRIWESEGLPPLQLKEPWWGYPCGHWTDRDQEEAELALTSDYFKTGERCLEGRQKV